MEEFLADEQLAEIDPDRQDLSYPSLLARRLTGAFPLDEWGFDRDLALILTPVASLLPRPRVHGVEHLPEVGSALIVADRWLAPFERVLLAATLARATRRPVRFTGVPDVAPLGPLLRRLGGVSGSSHDLRSLLRSGEVVLCAPGLDSHRLIGPGRPPEAALAVAMATGAPVLHLRLGGCLLGRGREVRLGEPVRTRGPASPSSVEQLVSLLADGLPPESHANPADG